MFKYYFKKNLGFLITCVVIFLATIGLAIWGIFLVKECFLTPSLVNPNELVFNPKAGILFVDLVGDLYCGGLLNGLSKTISGNFIPFFFALLVLFAIISGVFHLITSLRKMNNGGIIDFAVNIVSLFGASFIIASCYFNLTNELYRNIFSYCGVLIPLLICIHNVAAISFQLYTTLKTTPKEVTKLGKVKTFIVEDRRDNFHIDAATYHIKGKNGRFKNR